MNRKTTSSLLGWALLSAFAFGCSAATDDTSEPSASEEELVVVPPGKADNYYSNVSAEFEVSGTIDQGKRI